MIEVSIKNIDELISSLWKIDVRSALNRALQKSIFTVERTAKINTPVRTGLLRNSYEEIFWDLEATLRNYREYAPYVEEKVWFMENSIEAEVPNIETIFNNEINSLLQTI